jgi:MFS transporter, DHA3 family, macrolide efflux protein
LMAAHGRFAGSFGQMLGVGPGRGIALLFAVMGLIKVTVSLMAYLYPHIRRIEDDLPDMVHEEPLTAAS